MGDTLVVPGLPPLKWQRKSGWACKVSLPAWADLAPANDGLAAGEVAVTFECENIYDRPSPSAGQIEALHRLTEEAAELRTAILQSTFDEFHEHLNSTPWVVEQLGRPLTDPVQLTDLISVIAIAVRVESEDEPAELDLDFDCVWDPEDGFLIEAIGSRVTFVGSR